MGINDANFNSGIWVKGTIFKIVNVNNPTTTVLYPATALRGNIKDAKYPDMITA
jgi:hypothetical protein